MALVACKRCGHKVPEHSRICPHCHKPMSRVGFGNVQFVTVMLSILLVLALAILVWWLSRNS